MLLQVIFKVLFVMLITFCMSINKVAFLRVVFSSQSARFEIVLMFTEHDSTVSVYQTNLIRYSQNHKVRVPDKV